MLWYIYTFEENYNIKKKKNWCERYLHVVVSCLNLDNSTYDLHWKSECYNCPHEEYSNEGLELFNLGHYAEPLAMDVVGFWVCDDCCFLHDENLQFNLKPMTLVMEVYRFTFAWI